MTVTKYAVIKLTIVIEDTCDHPFPEEHIAQECDYNVSYNDEYGEIIDTEFMGILPDCPLELPTLLPFPLSYFNCSEIV